jgi:hypothetical protein
LFVGESPLASFAEYLARALDLLAVEAPSHFQAMRVRLGPLSLLIRIGAEAPVAVRLARPAPWVERRDSAAHAQEHVDIAVSRSDLAGFLRGEFTIEEGLDQGRLAIRGDLDHVLACLDALAAWLHGAFRSPSFPRLHRRYLATLQSA